jgi:hypothetical protein
MASVRMRPAPRRNRQTQSGKIPIEEASMRQLSGWRNAITALAAIVLVLGAGRSVLLAQEPGMSVFSFATTMDINLASLPPPAVQAHRFGAMLPAMSVTTFVGRMGR